MIVTTHEKFEKLSASLLLKKIVQNISYLHKHNIHNAYYLTKWRLYDKLVLRHKHPSLAYTLYYRYIANM